MLGLNGSLVRGQENAESDIDFLVVARCGRLYTARFFATILTELTGYRRKGNSVAGRICLNCYLPDNDLNIAPANPKSRKKVAWAYKYLIAMIDGGDYERKFREANKWFDKYHVAGRKYNVFLRKKMKSPRKPKKWGEKILAGRLGDFVERKLRDYQVRRILAGKKRGDEIVCKENEIRLHPRKVHKICKVKSS